ncbi:MAG: ribonuclease R [Lachnospiraceae bacterium]|uniref:ribonuclease R n=1 Tax=Candidatus Merdisoma sp. JLR.KK011 TaxID=3114299 RepID=UPI002FF2C3BF|nr:ribonuclease R [Lachnospiraceae bacterium]
MENKSLEEKKKIIYEFICDARYVPMKQKELAVLLQVEKERRPELSAALEELLAEGKLQLSKRGRYYKAEAKTVTGIFTSHPKGFGFVSVEDREEDIYIGESDTKDAFLGDTVQVGLKGQPDGKRQEGVILQVLSHGVTEVVGTFEKSKSFGFVVPDNQRITRDIFIPLEHTRGAVSGHKVVVELTDYGAGRKSPEGRIIEILGHSNDPGTDILSIVRAYQIPMEFSEKVLNQAERIAKPVSEADRQGRLDLRQEVCVTIDGEDAKDLDDAVSVRKEGENYVLSVHIADVANYVQENSALDWEAFERGTSVYLVDRVIPMLPHALSNGICSLNAGEDRLALSCIMTIDSRGKIIDHTIAETVIRVARRMTYTSVNRILEDRDAADRREYAALVPMFEEMKELAELLRRRRRKRGSIDFDFPETKILLDEAGKPVEIRPYERNSATRIIEDFMLAANETVAADYYWQAQPFVYRVHEKPDAKRLHKLALFLKNFGYSLHTGGDEVHPGEIQKLLDRLEGTPEEAMLSRLTLRAMQKAKYSTDCSGHFGLAAEQYCHFTSPIRRYPDLQIHRIIKENLRGRLLGGRVEHYEAILPEAAKHASETERRADEAERETEKLKKVEFMEQHIGEIFEGVISGITQYGLYVELANTVEGLVHVNSLEDDYYEYVEHAYELRGQRSGLVYRLGQRVKIRVKGTDRFLRTIDFQLAMNSEDSERALRRVGEYE